MWLFSKDSGTSFPYSRSTENEIKLLNGWILSNSVNKKGEEFSIFSHDMLNGDSLSKGIIQNSLKRMKTLKHPNIINFVDGNELAREIQIVTEKVVPLEKYLKEKGDTGNFTFIASWGLFQILRGLVFLNNTCKCQHNQVRLSSVFVNRSGDWKLGCFDYVTAISDSLPSSVLQTDLYWPLDKNKIDSYGFACLIWETFNHHLTRKTDLKVVSKIPSQLLNVFNKLIHPKSAMRLSLENAFKQLRDPAGFSDNFYVTTLLFLEEIQIKDQEEKQKFMGSLTDLVDSFPDDIAKYKILPHLLTCHQYGAAGIEVLLPLVKLGKLLDQSEFESSVVPRLVAMFRSSNRSTRVRLLEQLPSFVDILPYKVVDMDIFPAVVMGLSDTNPVVREATIRAVVHLAPKLSSKNLNDVLVNHLMNLQLKDEQGGIRTNATVCIAKISPLLSITTSQTSLLNVLLKCTRDPFVPAKLSAVSSLAASQHLFLIDDVATKLLPCLSFLTVDPEKDVREQTFKAMEFALSRLKEVSQNPELNKMAFENKEAQNSISWKNWAVSLIKKSEPNPPVNQSSPVKDSPGSLPQKEAVVQKPIPLTEPPKTITVSENDAEEDNDEWGSLEETNFSLKPKPKENFKWDSNPDDFFDDLIKEPISVPKPKLQLNKKNGVMKPGNKKEVVSNDDGWGDVDW